MIIKNSNCWNKKDFQNLISDSKSSDHGYQRAIANSKHPEPVESYIKVLG